ncbi:MAG: penicillin acylase family protein [Gloeobacteraceae cyanobacterium ES-bin-316]|nr:penicillin acylase family protein [Ferruginibacter sp.]
MKKIFFLLMLLPLQHWAQPFTSAETANWQQQAKNVNIIRDNWGIPHIYGKTDADAVFGLLYAQCEDDFKRVEMNYIEKLGRLAEVNGEDAIYSDLYVKLLIDSADAIADFKKAPAWLKKLLAAYADGINYYLYKNPQTKPALLTRFEPWYPLLWTDGSIGAISTGGINEGEVKSFYSGSNNSSAYDPKKFEEISTGSNGFAVGPAKTASGNAILYINPHVTFYFRPEVHMVSEEGLNVYGAVTWGQFFIYQGFNEYCGWMHTSNNVDVADMYIEKISGKENQLMFEYEKQLKKVRSKQIKIHYKNDGSKAAKNITALYTQHGPVMAKRNGQYISVQSSNRMMNGLIQSWQRTKAKGLEDYTKSMALRGNTSNSTVFADNKGNIAYWHGNYIPIRDKKYNWSKPVDGSIAQTSWQGIHDVKDIVQMINPKTNWIQNCNSTPYTVSGSSSPEKKNYPNYMAPDGENFRGINAAKVLTQEQKFNIEKMIAAGYDTYLSAFEVLVPSLVNAFEKNIQPSDSLYLLLKEPIDLLKKWDYRVAENSVATTLAVEWAQLLTADIRKVYVDEEEPDQVEFTEKYAATATPRDLLIPLLKVINDLKLKHGRWQVSWGSVNRYQRISNDINQKYDDAKESFPVPFASALWGMLPSYNSRYFSGTQKRYGVSGNSFVCAVEFGTKVKARSLLAGGNSGNPSSKHFKDQLLMYTQGSFKDVLFYKEDVLKNMEKQYHPGE